MSVDPLTCPAADLDGLEHVRTPIWDALVADHAPWIVLALDDQVEALAAAGTP